MTWYISIIILETSTLRGTQVNLHKRLRDMVTVACLHFWNGDTHAMNFQKMLMILRLKITWTTLESFCSTWMKLVSAAIIDPSWWHHQTKMRTIHSSCTSLHQKWPGKKNANMSQVNLNKLENNDERRSRGTISVKLTRQKKKMKMMDHGSILQHKNGLIINLNIVVNNVQGVMVHSSASSSWQWRPKNRWVYTSIRRR